MQRREVFRLLVSTVISVVATSVLLLCLMTDVVNFWLLSFFYSFRIHLGILSAFLAASAIVFFWRNYYAWLLTLAAVVTTGAAMMETRRFSPQPLRPEIAETAQEMRMLSFNVLGTNRHGKSVVRILRDLDPDIAVILEATAIHRFLPELSETYPYRVGCGVLDRQCDSLILSKYPLENPRMFDMSNDSEKRLAMADFTFGGRALRVVSLHLTKPYYDDKQRIDIWEAIRRLQNYDGDMILAGDFNSALLQPSTRNIVRRLDLRTGPTEPATWPVGAGPLGIPIDHILARPPLTIKQTRRIDDAAGSNHYGIYADILVPSLSQAQMSDVLAATP
jgi:endonuclease/exonuclease/phosphatase (EEP) superfamily protein YafD